MKNPVGMFLSIFWVNYERTLDEWLRYIVGIFWTNLSKKPKGFFKEWLKGILVGFLWSNSQFAHWVYWDQSGGLFLNKLSLYPLGLLRAKCEIKFQKSSIYPVAKLQVYCLKTLNKLSIYPLGNTPSAPSGSWNHDWTIHWMFQSGLLRNTWLSISLEVQHMIWRFISVLKLRLSSVDLRGMMSVFLLPERSEPTTTGGRGGITQGVHWEFIESF